jgi:hypothetical protein
MCTIYWRGLFQVLGPDKIITQPVPEWRMAWASFLFETIFLFFKRQTQLKAINFWHHGKLLFSSLKKTNTKNLLFIIIIYHFVSLLFFLFVLRIVVYHYVLSNCIFVFSLCSHFSGCFFFIQLAFLREIYVGSDCLSYC